MPEALATYIGTRMDFLKDVALIYKKMKKDEIIEPIDLTDEIFYSVTERSIQKTRVQICLRIIKAQVKNCESIFVIILGNAAYQ